MHVRQHCDVRASLGGNRTVPRVAPRGAVWRGAVRCATLSVALLLTLVRAQPMPKFADLCYEMFANFPATSLATYDISCENYCLENRTQILDQFALGHLSFGAHCVGGKMLMLFYGSDATYDAPSVIIPTSIGLFPDITEIRFMHTRLSAPLPSQLAQLSLQVFSLLSFEIVSEPLVQPMPNWVRDDDMHAE